MHVQIDVLKAPLSGAEGGRSKNKHYLMDGGGRQCDTANEGSRNFPVNHPQACLRLKVCMCTYVRGCFDCMWVDGSERK